MQYAENFLAVKIKKFVCKIVLLLLLLLLLLFYIYHFFIAPAYSRVRYRSSNFRPSVRPFVRSFVRSSVNIYVEV